jgi:N-acyl-D-amino-acid deacylase
MILQNGTIYDGSGGAAIRGDVRIHNGRIAQVGGALQAARGERVIDAAGMAVCPGFVDMHRHLDIQLLSSWDGHAELRQGITTAVGGNCGMSLAPASDAFAGAQYAFYEPVMGVAPNDAPRAFPDYMRALCRAKLPIHAGAMIGTGAVRTSIMGFSDAPMSADALSRAEGMIDEALGAGALGVSMGIMYQPECFNTPAEYARMLRPLGTRGGILCAHIRGEGDSLVKSVEEAIGIAARAGCALEISHFKACGARNWGRAIHRAIDAIEDARARGEDVACDFYPYDGGSTALTTMLPPDFAAGDMAGALARLGTRAGVDAFRAAVAREYPDWDNFALTLGWDRILISGVHAPENARMIGRSVAAAAAEFGFDDGAALAAHLMHTDGGRTAIINMSMCQADIDTVARLPYSSVISDALYSGAASPHPRLYGAFPKIIREYVLERGVLTLADAIRKMTALPASRMGISDRGRIAPGQIADVLIFDPQAFRDHADYGAPKRHATGLTMAILRGEVALEHDVPAGVFAGEAICRGRAGA